MNLKTSQLRNFRSASSPVKTNTIIPVLSYLKFEKGKVTKNSLHSFISFEIDYNGPAFLIEERIIYTMLDNTSAGEIEVALEGKSVTITDGKIKTKSESPVISEFPTASEPSGDWTLFNSNLLNKLVTASKFTDPEIDLVAKQLVFINKTHVRSSNGFIAFQDEIESGIETFIPGTVIQAVSKFENIQFNETESYQFFSTDTFVIGFVKPESKFIDMSSFFSFKGLSKIGIDKNDIIFFNNQAISNAVSKVAVTSMSVKEDSISLTMDDSSYNVDCSATVPAAGGVEDQIKYNPGYMNRLLKAMEGDNLIMMQAAGKLYFLSGKSISLIMQIV